jgi:hypothetical protein
VEEIHGLKLMRNNAEVLAAVQRRCGTELTKPNHGRRSRAADARADRDDAGPIETSPQTGVELCHAKHLSLLFLKLGILLYN